MNKSNPFPLFIMMTLGMLCYTNQAVQAQDVKRTIANFRLKATDGQTRSLADYGKHKAIVVVFIGTECPLVNQEVLKLKDMHADLTNKGVQILAINSNDQDSFAEIVKHARDRKLPFPVLQDEHQKVADLFGATLTPEAFVLDHKRAVRYHGRLDDGNGVLGERKPPTRHDLIEAVKDVLAGRKVRVAKTEVEGCFIGRDEGIGEDSLVDSVTYTKHIARILQKNCQECHRPGEVGPFSLLTYEDAKSWSRTMARVVRNGQMPPWHADPKHGKFVNDRTMSDKEKQLLLTWVDQGCPKGEDADMPEPRKFVKGWRIGQPDLVLKMKKAFRVPARPGKGGVPYQNFVLKTRFDKDVWIQKAEARPGNRAVVHHMTIYIGNNPDRQAGTSGERAIFGGYVPGNRPTILPDGFGIKIPKGSELILEMHYTANGTEQVDLSSVGLVFAKEKPKHEVKVNFVINNEFKIPPHADNHAVKKVTTLKKDIVLFSLFPHMHLRGKAYQIRAIYPDNKQTVLLKVPHYDFNWQHSYILKEPLRLPAGTKLECIGWFDNSADNPHNPNPNRTVGWGEQTWDEMMLAAFTYIHDEE